jgi:hypothetical protein
LGRAEQITVCIQKRERERERERGGGERTKELIEFSFKIFKCKKNFYLIKKINSKAIGKLSNWNVRQLFPELSGQIKAQKRHKKRVNIIKGKAFKFTFNLTNAVQSADHVHFCLI